MKAAPPRSADARWAGVRATCSAGTTAGRGATARRGPPAYSPARKHAMFPTAERDSSQRCATFRAEER
eukprot:5086332-Pleurochrysis_carterae.AAC.1